MTKKNTIKKGGIIMNVKNLIDLRKQNKKTQSEIAKYLNLTTAGYNKYEINKTEPSIENLKKLADYYNVSLDYLVGREFASKYAYLTENEKNLLDIFREMTEDNQQVYYQEGKGILLAQNVKF